MRACAETAFLCPGSKETLQFSNFANKFEIVNKKEIIYRKIE